MINENSFTVSIFHAIIYRGKLSMNKNKSYAILLFLILTQVIVSLARVPSNGSINPPNILFVFSDDHAWQSIGAYGGRLKEVGSYSAYRQAG
jgi:hypothetical protein